MSPNPSGQTTTQGKAPPKSPESKDVNNAAQVSAPQSPIRLTAIGDESTNGPTPIPMPPNSATNSSNLVAPLPEAKLANDGGPPIPPAPMTFVVLAFLVLAGLG